MNNAKLSLTDDMIVVHSSRDASQLLSWLELRNIISMPYEDEGQLQEKLNICVKPVSEISDQDINDFKIFLEACKPGTDRRQQPLRFSEAMLANRGGNDYFTILILNWLLQNNIQVEVIFGKHEYDFVRIISTDPVSSEQPRKYIAETPEGKEAMGDSSTLEQVSLGYKSTTSMMKLLESSNLQKETRDRIKIEIGSLIHNIAAKQFKLISYTQDIKDITIVFTYGSCDLNDIATLARSFGIEEINVSSLVGLKRTIDEINKKFIEQLLQNTISEETRKFIHLDEKKQTIIHINTDNNHNSQVPLQFDHAYALQLKHGQNKLKPVEDLANLNLPLSQNALLKKIIFIELILLLLLGGPGALGGILAFFIINSLALSTTTIALCAVAALTAIIMGAILGNSFYNNLYTSLFGKQGYFGKNHGFANAVLISMLSGSIGVGLWFTTSSIIAGAATFGMLGGIFAALVVTLATLAFVLRGIISSYIAPKPTTESQQPGQTIRNLPLQTSVTAPITKTHEPLQSNTAIQPPNLNSTGNHLKSE
jgi:hypothetical protein